MFEAVFEKQPALIVPVLALSGSAVVFVVWIIAAHWKGVRQMDVEATLKQDMLNRGLSVADIERVLWASSDGPPRDTVDEAQKAITDNEYYLVEKMLDEGRSVEEIERLVRAFKGNSSTAIKTIEEVARRA
jgi:hypothetical protein